MVTTAGMLGQATVEFGPDNHVQLDATIDAGHSHLVIQCRVADFPTAQTLAHFWDAIQEEPSVRDMYALILIFVLAFSTRMGISAPAPQSDGVTVSVETTEVAEPVLAGETAVDDA